MRILWLHQYFSTPKGWGAVRTYEFARRFVAKGHSVDVVCCDGYDDWLLEEAGERGEVEVDGIKVFVSKTKYVSRMSFRQRVFSFLKFMIYANSFVLKNGAKYDLCIASSGPLTMAIPALAGRLIHKLPYVFEVIDVWPDSAIDAGILKSKVLKMLSFFVEKMAYRYSEAIVLCSTGMSDRIINKIQNKSDIIPEHRMVVDDFSVISIETRSKTYKLQTISNSCDREQFKPDICVRRKMREKCGVDDDKLIVLYSGAMGVSNQIDDVVEAVNATKGNEGIVWWFAGDGVRFNDLKALEYPERVRFFGRLSKVEVARLYQSADVNLVTFMHSALFYENSPNKFFDGIAAGLPAIFNRSTWLGPWLREYKCGVVCDGDSPGTKMAEELKSLSKDRKRLKEMSIGALRLAEDVFSRDLLAVKYEALLIDSQVLP
ncbi:MAG: glycosyltransferase family 4 protein [Kiritimatiellae bacterium]|nr:glycosyltransferase family 4 protein [Kiritimatiellia bacterium]